MNPNMHDCRIDVRKTEKAFNDYLARPDDVGNRERRRRVVVLTRFLTFLYNRCKYVQGSLVLRERHLWRWLRKEARTFISESVMRSCVTVNEFLDHLVHTQAASGNLLAAIKGRFGRRGWTGIVLALQSGRGTQSMNALRVRPPFRGVFGQEAQIYLEMHRATGSKYKTNEAILKEFNRYLKKHTIDSLDAITPGLVVEWVRSQTCTQGTRYGKLLRLAHFFRYLHSLQVVRSNPVTPAALDTFFAVRSSLAPHIYTHDQIVALLEASRKLPRDRWYKLKPETFSLLIALLYTLGLRLGEALRIQIGDIDFDQQTIHIRPSKFRKERLLPFGPRLAEAIRHYLEVRLTLFTPVPIEAPLFIGRYCAFMSVVKIDKSFPALLQAARIVTQPGHQHPRLHDLRHTFAVHRLIRWYKEGADVQSKLILLSTFMGHVDIFSTQLYLTMTDELLNEANRRFHGTFGKHFDREVLP